MVIILMGVAGAGKTSVGRRLADRQGWVFVDADDLHPAGNLEKMAAGVSLTGEDRQPWLLSVRHVIAEHSQSDTPVVVACSALKRSYRRLLMDGLPDVKLVYLRGEPALLERRLADRKGHFFDPRLLASQLETLEEPVNALVVDIDVDLETVIEKVEAALGIAST